MRLRIAAGLAVPLILGACAHPTVVQSMKPGDSGLSCAQLQNEYADAERFRDEADKEKSITGGNVARAIFFWPAILGTASNANEAIAAADSRKVHLANQMANKNCGAVAAGISNAGQDPKVLASGGTTKEAQLIELKRLFEANLISKEAYAEKQKSILDAP
ncbi:hypothetical protein [Rhodoferax sp. GW822-FHT02A01]|uniref:hypothetical protein n=1 Tax=Rhodoferax sp. GW822-FHT02A01 TaxID=3141537 RepID=UPI00315D736F